MMSYQRILTVQDISCVGQCSLTVALPILSACGLETAVLPSAVLSTHTAGFTGYTFRDLTDDMPDIRRHWEKEHIGFDAVYTGYLGSVKQMGYIKDILGSCLREGGRVIVDPAMADNGKLYPGFDGVYADAMKTLCFDTDAIIVPNITEACLLADVEYREEYDESYVMKLIDRLTSAGAKTTVLTGVSYTKDTTGVVVYEEGKASYYRHRKCPKGCHGTGDVYSSAFVGALMRGRSCFDAARIAADYTVDCIEFTSPDPEHWYGVKFEPLLPELIKAVG